MAIQTRKGFSKVNVDCLESETNFRAGTIACYPERTKHQVDQTNNWQLQTAFIHTDSIGIVEQFLYYSVEMGSIWKTFLNTHFNQSIGIA